MTGLSSSETTALACRAQPLTVAQATLHAAKAILITIAVAVGIVGISVPAIILNVLYDVFSDQVVLRALYGTLTIGFILTARCEDHDWRKILGWRAFKLDRRLAFFAILVVVNIALETAVAKIYPDFYSFLGLDEDTNLIDEDAILLVLAVPVLEETIFRGYLHHRLRSSLNPNICIAISSTLFAAAHIDSGLLYPLLVLPSGIVLGYARERLRSIGPCILLHMMFNFAAFAQQHFDL